MALIFAAEEDCRALALTDDERTELARAAFLAMIEAWEGMSQLEENDSASIREMAALILPLPQEASDGR